MMMAFCPNCGAAIQPDSPSCVRCGATFTSDDPWKPGEQQPTVAVPDYRPWKLAFFGLFLLADAVFVGIHQALGVLPLSSIYSQTQRVFLYTVVYSGQFLAAFAVGMVLSLVYGLFAGQRGSAYRRVTWMRALAIALLPAAFVVYIAWWG